MFAPIASDLLDFPVHLSPLYCVVCEKHPIQIQSRVEKTLMDMDEKTVQGANVQFSPTYTFSGKGCRFSPDGKYILFTTGKQVEVIQSDTQASVFTLFCSDRVDYTEWSPDSTRILCIIRRNNSIEVDVFMDRILLRCSL